MPNPYHDETGRFCSKEEMGAAVDRLGTAVAVAGDDGSAGFKERYKQALDAYFELRRDYDAINSGVMAMPEGWVASVAASGLQAMPDTAGGIENLYRSALEYNIRKPNDFHAAKGIAVLTNPETPQWIKDDIYRNASVEAKAAMIRHLGYNEEHPEITSEELLPFTWGENGSRNEVTQALLESSRIGFDVKYELAKERGNLGYLVALNPGGEQSLFRRVPTLQSDLQLEFKNPLRPKLNRHIAAKVLARNTDSAELRAELARFEDLRGAGYDSVLSNLTQNPHLTDGEGAGILRQVADLNAQQFEHLHGALIERQDEIGSDGPLTVTYDQRMRNLGSTRSYRGVSQEREQDARAAVSAYDYQLDEGAHANPLLPRESQELAVKTLGMKGAADHWQQLATLDAQPGRYDELRKEVKRLEKERAKAAKQGNRDAQRSLLVDAGNLQARVTRAQKLRYAQLMTAQVESELAQQPVAA